MNSALIDLTATTGKNRIDGQNYHHLRGILERPVWMVM
ncbi:hypothetical protein X747_31865 [Mesorhizobium sp. LNJC384A00]|nr:hypothetical protein X747_31865 [Mesorhizobium sp. LNJC384A00]